MAEFEVGGHTYRVDKMNAREQLHLLRGLGPLLTPMVQMAAADKDETSPQARQLAFMIPFFEAFAKMEESEVNTIVNKCFSVTRRREGANGSTTWGPPMWNVGSGREQYNDYDLGALMTICWNVIQENLGSFFDTGSGQPISATALRPGLASPL
jgi:hypothetical protein